MGQREERIKEVTRALLCARVTNAHASLLAGELNGREIMLLGNDPNQFSRQVDPGTKPWQWFCISVVPPQGGFCYWIYEDCFKYF